MKRIILIIVLAIIMGAGFYVHADTPSNSGFYYIFHLYYDTGKLVADRDFKFSYDVIPGDFVASPITTQFPYRGEVVNMVGEVVKTFQFDPREGGALKGKISVNAPYVADGQKVIFYDNQNQPILTISVSESSFCNDDGICNADRGEDSLSCPNDCKQSLATPLPTPASPTGESNGLWSGILYTLGGLILAGLGWWLFKRRRNSNNMTLPPTLPSGGQALPTPPPPTSGSVTGSNVDMPSSLGSNNPV